MLFTLGKKNRLTSRVPIYSMCTILPPDFMQFGSVGVPVPSCEIKLVDCPEANYFSSTVPPKGEIWIRGNSVTDGYC